MVRKSKHDEDKRDGTEDKYRATSETKTRRAKAFSSLQPLRFP